jgi:hypothetical protein
MIPDFTVKQKPFSFQNSIQQILDLVHQPDSFTELNLRVQQLIEKINVQSFKNPDLEGAVRSLKYTNFQLRTYKIASILQRVEELAKIILKIITSDQSMVAVKKTDAPDQAPKREEKDSKEMIAGLIPFSASIMTIMVIKSKPYSFIFDDVDQFAPFIIRNFPENFYMICLEPSNLYLLKSYKRDGIIHCSKELISIKEENILISNKKYKSLDDYFTYFKPEGFVVKYEGLKYWKSKPYFKDFTQPVADKFMHSQKENSYLIRNSSIPFCLTLSVRMKDHTDHLLLVPQEKGIYISNQFFPDFDALERFLLKINGWFPIGT